MKKLVLFLFFLIVSVSTVFAYPECLDISALQINAPADDYTLAQGSEFEFSITITSTDPFGPGYCTTNATFEHDQRIGSFIRIKDPLFDPGNNDLNTVYSSLIAVDVNSVAYGYATIFVQCNTAGDYQLRFSVTGGGGVQSTPVTIHCLSSNTPPNGNFIKPSSPSFVYGYSYRVEWDAFDAEGDSLSYDIEWNGPTSGTDTTTNKYYDLTGLSLGDYTFDVNISDGVNPEVKISSSTLTVKKPLNTLSVSGLSITPEVIYGDEALDVNLTLRNNSSNEVDINVLFYNDDFLPNPAPSRVINIAPYSKADFSVHQDFSSNNIGAGDYNVRIYAEEFFSGTSNPTGNVLTSFANFTVLADKKSVALPETNFFFVLLIALTVIGIINRK